MSGISAAEIIKIALQVAIDNVVDLFLRCSVCVSEICYAQTTEVLSL